MMREFQVVYQETKREMMPVSKPVSDSSGNEAFILTHHEPANVPHGELKTLNMVDRNEQLVRQKLETAFFHVVSVTQIRAVVDWTKPVLDLDEFAALCGIGGKSLSAKKGDGTIPWCSRVNGVPMKLAMAWIEENLNPAGRKLLAKLA